MNHRSSLLALVLPLAVACSGGSSPAPPPAGCPAGATCVQAPRGPVHPLRADKTVDITVTEAWPNRAMESAPLTAAEHGLACAIWAGCVGKSDAERLTLIDACGNLSSEFWEERAVMAPGKNERWPYEARAAIAVKNDCAAVLALETKRPGPINCEEDGCWWTSVTSPLPVVTCAGDVATLVSAGTTYTRDCTHALATCDASSPTGCTDRAPTACDSTDAIDRCDGDVRIGCDGTGKVSFHDCARVRAKCVTTGGKSGCVAENAGECASTGLHSCAADSVEVCVDGKKIVVPLADARVTTCTPS